MDNKLKQNMVEYFINQRSIYDDTWQTATSEWQDNKLIMHNIITEEITEQTFSADFNEIDFEQYKLREQLSNEVNEKICSIIEYAEKTYSWDDEINTYLAGNAEYQALNRMFDLISYEKYDDERVYTY
jgi:hypothetical protein